MKTKVWKQFRNLNYDASSEGEVRNRETGKILSQRMTTQGYKQVDIQIDKKNKTFKVHRIIAESFLGAKENDEKQWQVDHIDRDKANNKLENLRWVTRSENLENRIVTKRKNFEINMKMIKDIIELYKSGKSPNEIYLLI